VADVDGDGRDEIIYGAAVIDDDGKGLYSTGWGHGDALHVSDLDPANPGLEVFDIQERFGTEGMSLRDAAHRQAFVHRSLGEGGRKRRRQGRRPRAAVSRSTSTRDFRAPNPGQAAPA
jgi:rhamnogalacturonan endolyase